MNFFKRLWGDDRGQSTTEYILILSVVVLVALKFKGTFGKQLDQLLEKLNGSMEKSMQQDP